MFNRSRSKIKIAKFVTAGLLVIFLFSLPAFATARGGVFLGSGAGLLTGYLVAPRPVYVAPPVYIAQPQVVQGNSESVPAPPAAPTQPPAAVPPPPAPSTPGYSGSANVPAPGNQAKCREWKMVDRHLEDRWDSYNGKWRQVPVEKWGWVEVPCNNEEAPAGVQGNVNIGPPPEDVLPAPPSLAVIPGTYVYVVPDVGMDILFFRGYWYRPYGGRWYWAQSYNGPWVYLAPGRVPGVLLELPPGYRRLPPGYHRIPYAELHANWWRWEREQYWHRNREWREGWRRH
jgi:hypothetical protein